MSYVEGPPRPLAPRIFPASRNGARVTKWKKWKTPRFRSIEGDRLVDEGHAFGTAGPPSETRGTINLVNFPRKNSKGPGWTQRRK